uniref:protein sel-1 homolog 3 isoform X2 n=1 Tax=Semicossyphus pulcher TaxID=241346 RepID=UPI0037E8532C
MFHSLTLGYLCTAAVLLGHCVSQTISSSSAGPAESPADDFIDFQSAPDRVVDGSAVCAVRYRCSRPCQLTVEVLVSTLRKTDFFVFRKKWISSSRPGAYRIRPVRLGLPPSLLYQQDFFNRHVMDAQNVTVRAFLHHLNDASKPGVHKVSILGLYKVLQVKPLSERPAKPPTACPSWSAHLMWQMRRNRTRQCAHESGIIDVLTFPMASSGEHFGLVRRLQPFIDRSLERARHRAVSRPSVTLSVWIYLLNWCHTRLCGIIHHMDGKNSYDSVLMLLTHAGDVIIQVRVTTGREEAFEAGVELPLRKWIRLDCTIRDAQVLLDATWDDKSRRSTFEFRRTIRYDDTEGYFVMGGGRFMAGVRGYIGPVKFYRFGTEEVKNELQPKSTLQKLDRTHQECREMKTFAEAFLKQVTRSSKGVCTPPFIRLWGRSGEKRCTQTWTWEQQLKYSRLFHFLQAKEEEIRTGSLSMKDLGRALFEQSVNSVFTRTQDNKITFNSTSLLQESSCFGNHKASLLLATIHLSGLGHSADQQQQHVVEHIYLSNPEDLSRFSQETDDVFQYLTFQAERGDVESQRHLAAMLYRGEHTVDKDTDRAVKWFERSAMQMKDAAAMYDYSIILMKGEGAKKNGTRGFQLMKKAAEMGSINALNALGWYYGNVLKDHRNAKKYFEQAALNGSEHGMFNLGIYYLNGMDPDSPERNETAAFQQFLKASWFGHVAGSVEAAWYLATGSLAAVSQDVEGAVIMLKKVCEQNGHLGFMIREALQAYLRGSWQEAFVKYVLAAETGLGLAQSNAAHLCEELSLSPDCQWRYHNYSILNYDPHPSALLKMGDYYYLPSSTRADSLSLVGRAISMYGRAAVAGSPQGMFNLVLLVRQGHALPSNIYGLFDVSPHDEQHVVVTKILKRCVEAEAADAVTPCSFALLGVQMGEALSRMTQSAAQLVLAYASLLSAFVVIVIMLLQSCLGQRVPAPRVRARTSPPTQDGDSMNREQEDVTGGTFRAAGILEIIALKGEQWLRQTGDLAVTVLGVCLCAFWTTLLYHLL